MIKNRKHDVNFTAVSDCSIREYYITITNTGHAYDIVRMVEIFNDKNHTACVQLVTAQFSKHNKNIDCMTELDSVMHLICLLCLLNF